MYMPVMDHRIIANMKPGEMGWAVDRALTVEDDQDSLNVNAHVYPQQGPGINLRVAKSQLTGYWVGLYLSDYPDMSTPFYEAYITATDD
jgi:hypothetical protein